MEGGIALLPLHDGHVPSWLARYMKRLAKAIASVIVEEYGPGEFVRRLADPFWFQAFNNAIGMDWDSSGSTTVTIGILRQVTDEDPGLGLVVSGGKGQLARSPPKELPKKAERIGAPSRSVDEALRASMIAAKTDSSLLQDEYQLYHHALILASDGTWAIVQQGMNPSARLARRYHWLRPLPRDPTLEPHKAIASGRREQVVLNLVSKPSIEARKTILDIACQSPSKTLSEIYEAYRLIRGIKPLTLWISGNHLKGWEGSSRSQLLKIYAPQPSPPRGIGDILRRIYEVKPRNMEELITIRGVGPSVIRSLALVSELIYNVPPSHEDPANTPLDPFRYAYIVGGKDGVPFPFNPRLAEEVISFLERAIESAKLGDKEKLRALRRLRSLLPRTPYRSQF